MRKEVWLVLVLVFSLSFVTSAGLSDRLIMMYNNHADFPDENGNGLQDSYETALYYAVKRNVSLNNVIAVDAQWIRRDVYSRYNHFVDNYIGPLNTKLATLGKTNIDYILNVYGIPSKLGSRTLDSVATIPGYQT